jgi:hypothetical protein
MEHMTEQKISRFKQEWQTQCSNAHEQVLNLRYAFITTHGFNIDVRSPQFVLVSGLQTWTLNTCDYQSRDGQIIQLIQIADAVIGERINRTHSGWM